MNAISKDILTDFRKLANDNPELKALYRKLYATGADYLDADKYALELARTLGKAMQKNLGGELLTGQAYWEIVSEALPSGLYRIYDEVADYAQVVQKGINERMGVGLNAVKPKFNTEEASAIVQKAVSADSYDKVPGGLSQDMQHMAQNVATDTMKANAKLANDVGYEATVTRIYDRVGVHTQDGGKYRKECQWCLERCGVDVPYSDAIANDMFRRHPGCGCEIRYTVNGRTQRQTDWQQNQWEDAEAHRRSSINTLNAAQKGLDGVDGDGYNNSPAKDLRKIYEEDVKAGWISPLVSFEQYVEKYNAVENLIGQKTTSGITITGQRRHFMQRVCGTAVDPKIYSEEHKKVHRDGIEIEDLEDAVKNGLPRPIKIGENGPSQLFVGKKCLFSINPETGKLIQCNKNSKKFKKVKTK